MRADALLLRVSRAAALLLLLCVCGLAPASADDTKPTPPAGNQNKPENPGGENPKPEPGKLSPDDEALLKCASSDELLLIQSLQRSIEGFQREMDALEKPYMDANDAAWAASDHYDELKAEGSTASEEEIKAAGENAFRLHNVARRLWDGIKKRDSELEANIIAADKDLRTAIAKIRARGCPPPAPGKAVKPGPGLPLPHEGFVMPVLPECFNDEKDRAAFDDKVYELFLEQINASSLAGTPEARAAARQNVDALAALRSKIFLVPLCALKDIGKTVPPAHGPKKGSKKGKKRHGKRAVTEDSPFYMENYHTPSASHGAAQDSGEGQESPPYSPPPGEDEHRQPPNRLDLPTPPDSAPPTTPTAPP